MIKLALPKVGHCCAPLTSLTLLTLSFPAMADGAWQRIVQQCASYVTCPSNPTPAHARKLRGMGTSLDQAIRWCAVGYGCPDGMSRPHAETLEGGRPSLTSEEQQALHQLGEGGTSRFCMPMIGWPLSRQAASSAWVGKLGAADTH